MSVRRRAYVSSGPRLRSLDTILPSEGPLAELLARGGRVYCAVGDIYRGCFTNCGLFIVQLFFRIIYIVNLPAGTYIIIKTRVNG